MGKKVLIVIGYMAVMAIIMMVMILLCKNIDLVATTQG